MTFSGRKASQNAFELESFVNFLKENRVQRYAEIGSREGDTFHHVMSSLPKGSFGVAVDLPGGLWGKSTTRNGLVRAVNDLKDYDVRYIFGDSQSAEVAHMLEEFGPFDAILIDGDHTLEGVTKDWNNYKSMAKIIAFHDIVGTGQRERVYKKGVEVPILWDQIKKDYTHYEFIDQDSKMGIGVIVRD